MLRGTGRAGAPRSVERLRRRNSLKFTEKHETRSKQHVVEGFDRKCNEESFLSLDSTFEPSQTYAEIWLCRPGARDAGVARERGSVSLTSPRLPSLIHSEQKGRPIAPLLP